MYILEINKTIEKSLFLYETSASEYVALNCLY